MKDQDFIVDERAGLKIFGYCSSGSNADRTRLTATGAIQDLADWITLKK